MVSYIQKESIAPPENDVILHIQALKSLILDTANIK